MAKKERNRRDMLEKWKYGATSLPPCSSPTFSFASQPNVSGRGQIERVYGRGVREVYSLKKFQKACIKYGVPDVDLFQTVDLWDKKNIAQVTMTIFAIGRTAYKHPEWRGPYLGPRPSEENRRDFSEEQLRAGEAIIGLQAGQNRGANQSGQNFGATRKILLGK
ncbi:hypothetical protein RUM43_001679 [Polyplax serrata]|uniref:Uncharacterized protein n=1 Tax=Polyplax serrata TaxID=468196 RepID=A0AAN8XUC7_POLSC